MNVDIVSDEHGDHWVEAMHDCQLLLCLGPYREKMDAIDAEIRFRQCLRISDRYNEGYTLGYEKGYDEGYEEGHDEGHDEGYGEGYKAGREGAVDG